MIYVDFPDADSVGAFTRAAVGRGAHTRGEPESLRVFVTNLAAHNRESEILELAQKHGGVIVTATNDVPAEPETTVVESTDDAESFDRAHGSKPHSRRRG